MENHFKTTSSRLLMLLVAVLTLSGCSQLTPYNLNIGAFNETPPQQRAVITISDPQVFARETLINDRLREQKLLNSLLDESEKIDFRDKISIPALIRDVETLEALRTAAELSFDPAKGAEAIRKERLDDLQNQIEITKKETDLVNAKKNLEKARGEGGEKKQDVGNPGNSPQTPPSKPEKTGDPSTGSPPTTQSSQTKTEPQQVQTAAPKDALKTPEGRLDTLAEKFSKRKEIAVPIPDAERTRDAYRAEIRQRLNAVNLDDLHDYSGNALYRLQFRATVMPGQDKDKFGIARLTFYPPLLGDREINELYLTWLNHLALRLNQPLPEIRKECPKPVAALLRLEEAGLFEIREIQTEPFRLSEPSDKCIIYAPIPIELSIPTALSHGNVPEPSARHQTEKPRQPKLSELIDSMPPSKKVQATKNVMPILEVIRTANEDNRRVRDAVQEEIDEIRKVGKTLSPEIFSKATVVKAPELFRQILVEDACQRNGDKRTAASQGKFVGRGEAYVYAASPLEKSQRLSTHAQTARSAEMALSLAANLLTKGMSAKSKIETIRQSEGIAEGFENQPIVVGFAERSALTDQKGRSADPPSRSVYQAPQAGWVFGPEVRLDPEKNQLQLVQRFASHEVSVDLSVPGWWPYVRTTLETAWIGNLHHAGRPIRLDQDLQSEEFQIRFPLTTADLDGLTAVIARKTVGTYLPTIAIQHVEPFFISACSKEVELLVKGVNVWRGTRAFWGGIEAENIAVLPDMEGIAARFDLGKLFATNNQALTGLGLDQGISLVVWTRNGSDVHTLRLIGNRTPDGASCIGRTTASASTSLKRFEIVDIAPAQLCADAKEANFLVKGYPYTKGKAFTAILGKSEPENVEPLLQVEDGEPAIFKLKFSDGPFGAAGFSVSLSMTDGKDISSTPVRLIKCETPDIPSPRTSADVDVTPLTKLSKPGEDITFTLPPLHDKAYPDLAKAKLKSEIVGQSNVILAVEADFSKVGKDRKVKGTIKLRDEAAEKAWNDLKAGDYTVKFSFEGAKGPDIPQIQIKKQ